MLFASFRHSFWVGRGSSGRGSCAELVCGHAAEYALSAATLFAGLLGDLEAFLGVDAVEAGGAS